LNNYRGIYTCTNSGEQGREEVGEQARSWRKQASKGAVESLAK